MKQFFFSLIIFQFLFLHPFLKQANAEVNLDSKSINIPANAIPYRNSWYCMSGYERSGGSCIKVPEKIPKNAYKSGDTWYCKNGYKKFGDICTPENNLISREVEKVSTGSKSSLSNLSDANICSWFDLKNVPDQYINEASKRNLHCNGKVLIATSKSIKIPANAFKSGNTWYCKNGYKKTGNACTKIVSNNIKIPANAYKSGNTWYCNSGYIKKGNVCDKVVSGTKSSNQEVFPIIFILFCFMVFLLIFSNPRRTNKKCAWCNNSKIRFIQGVEQNWSWRYSNKDGSRDKRRKDNYQQAKYKSKFHCQKCNATTGFLHEESKRPGPNVKIFKRKLLQRGSGERTGTNYG